MTIWTLFLRNLAYRLLDRTEAPITIVTILDRFERLVK